MVRNRHQPHKSLFTKAISSQHNMSQSLHHILIRYWNVFSSCLFGWLVFLGEVADVLGNAQLLQTQLAATHAAVSAATRCTA
jgi:hypothetical protein